MKSAVMYSYEQGVSSVALCKNTCLQRQLSTQLKIYEKDFKSAWRKLDSNRNECRNNLRILRCEKRAYVIENALKNLHTADEKVQKLRAQRRQPPGWKPPRPVGDEGAAGKPCTRVKNEASETNIKVPPKSKTQDAGSEKSVRVRVLRPWTSDASVFDKNKRRPKTPYPSVPLDEEEAVNEHVNNMTWAQHSSKNPGRMHPKANGNTRETTIARTTEERRLLNRGKVTISKMIPPTSHSFDTASNHSIASTSAIERYNDTRLPINLRSTNGQVGGFSSTSTPRMNYISPRLVETPRTYIGTQNLGTPRRGESQNEARRTPRPNSAPIAPLYSSSDRRFTGISKKERAGIRAEMDKKSSDIRDMLEESRRLMNYVTSVSSGEDRQNIITKPKHPVPICIIDEEEEPTE